MAEFLMPKLGADMTAGKLITWRKGPGDVLQRGDIIADVETDKADIEVEVFINGVLEKILVQPGEKVPVGTVLAIIREEGKPLETTPSKAPSEVILPPSPRAFVPTMPISTEPSPSEPHRLRISPAAKKLAAELGIDPGSLKGTGPGGRITREDVELAARPVSQLPGEELAANKQARMRQAIAASMARSKREIPHYYLSTTIDMSQALAWLTEENLRRPVERRLLYGVLLIKAVAMALREIPELNGFWIDEKGIQSDCIHIGVAISLRGGGLIAPALHNCDQRSLDDLMQSLLDLVKRTRAGRLRSSELSDATITVTNLGEQGVESVFGIIYPPQVALVGFGKPLERPCVSDGKIDSRPQITATLSADHRVSDGHRGGLFLAAVDRLLQEPTRL
jgi:pyruvate dehydrogenase E2 component (dihydrolipoamide acetyltransferase)